jgi:LacI family transcriptional regulator
MRATIKMIAERAGVSIGTVDRVLHNRPYVKPEVRERVLQVMEELDYHPNRMASALALSGTSRRFAVVQPIWEGYVGEAIAAGVTKFREERRDYNLSVTVRTYHQGRTAECLQHLEELETEGVQGIALCASDCPAVRRALTELSHHRIPVVTFNSDIAEGERLCFVGEDAHRAGRLAGEIASKFLGTGDQVLLVYAGPEYAGHKGRADGFLDRLEEVGFPREGVRVAATHENYQETFDAVAAALAEEPRLKCIYMANQSVQACAEALRQAGLAGKVRLVAHDNSPEIRALLREGVLDFTIDQNLSYQTRKALSVLFDAVLEHKRPQKDSYYPDSPILTAENC